MSVDNKYSILGVNITATDYERCVERITSCAKSRQTLGVSALAVHGVMTGVMDDEHRHRLNGLEMLVPDGQPVRWALNLLYKQQLKDRVYGPNLMLKTCEAAAENGLPIFLFGGKQELLEMLSDELLKKFPMLQIAGMLASKFRRVNQQEKLEIIKEIKSSGAAITFVGLGCPRQEVWTYEFKDQLQMPVLAVGAAFNFHAGLLDQAPGFFQDWGLEWLYRLTKEPMRLWQRYLLLNPYYVFLLTLQFLGFKKFSTDDTTAPDREILYG